MVGAQASDESRAPKHIVWRSIMVHREVGSGYSLSARMAVRKGWMKMTDSRRLEHAAIADLEGGQSRWLEE
ncbi:MAG: hypothetical protein CL927_16290 [Deltaproteobacteria bacterium]|nr:hypothetical protein [Deltaproteobacteria bacterium]